MKYLLLLIAFTFTRCAHAGVPSCFPGFFDPNVDEPIPTVRISEDGKSCATVWFCDDVHKWKRYAVFGHDDECSMAYEKAVALLALPKAAKELLWQQTFTAAGVATGDETAWQLAQSVSTPLTPPPSGLVTQDTKAYKVSSSVNKSTLTLVGSVPLGVPCDATQTTNGLYRIDRTKVTFPKGVLLPTTTWAKCL